jgi:hypothetical protein
MFFFEILYFDEKIGRKEGTEEERSTLHGKVFLKAES